jgi:hypothetical protein
MTFTVFPCFSYDFHVLFHGFPMMFMCFSMVSPTFSYVFPSFSYVFPVTSQGNFPSSSGAVRSEAVELDLEIIGMAMTAVSRLGSNSIFINIYQ